MVTWSESSAKAAAEIEALANQLGVDLPLSIEQILQLEERGATVNLVTGQVNWNGANDRFRVTAAAESVLQQGSRERCWHDPTHPFDCAQDEPTNCTQNQPHPRNPRRRPRGQSVALWAACSGCFGHSRQRSSLLAPFAHATSRLDGCRA